MNVRGPLLLALCASCTQASSEPEQSSQNGEKTDSSSDVEPADASEAGDATDAACSVTLLSASRSDGELRAEVLYDPAIGEPALLIEQGDAPVAARPMDDVHAWGRLQRASFSLRSDAQQLSLRPYLARTDGRLFANAEPHVLPPESQASVAGPSEACLWDPMVTLRDQTARVSDAAPTGTPDGGWYVTPLHTVLTHAGDVVVTGWGRAGFSECVRGSESRRHGLTFTLDPADLERGAATSFDIQPIDERPVEDGDVLYCAGHAPMQDGRVFYAGGAGYVGLGSETEYEYGLDYARIFDPRSGTFENIDDPMPGGPQVALPGDPTGTLGSSGRRCYPSVTRLPNGTMMVVGGMTTCCPEPELNLSIDLFDAQTGEWTTAIEHAIGLEAAGIGIRDYPHTFVLPRPVELPGGGEAHVALLGTKAEVTLLDIRAGMPEQDRVHVRPGAVRPHASDDPNVGEESTALMIPSWDGSSTAELVIIGGGKGDLAANSRADIYNPYTDSWRSIDLGIGRYTGSAVLLPTGDIMVTGGWGGPGGVEGWRRAQIINPQTAEVQTFEPWADDPTQRGYHNVSLPLRDGRVLIGGGVDEVHDIGCEKPQLRLFNPPYLYKGPRPIPREVPDQLELGQSYTLQLDAELDDKRGLLLTAPGAFTHSFDQNARLVPLAHTRNGKTVTFEAPQDAWAAPPGEYFLVAVSEAGVPSEGIPVRVTAP